MAKGAWVGVLVLVAVSVSAPIVGGLSVPPDAGEGPGATAAAEDRPSAARIDARVNVSGRILEADGSPGVDDFVSANPVDTDEFTGFVFDRTASDGAFSIRVDRNRTYDVRAFQFDETAGHFGGRDGTVDVYAIDRRSFASDTDLGEESLPSGYAVNVTAVDGNGDPVSNASVNVTHTAAGATASLVQNPTTGDGLMVAKALPGFGVNRSDVPGLELRGNVTIEARPPEGTTRFSEGARVRRLTVTGDRNVRIRFDETPVVCPEDGCGVPSDPDGDGRREDVDGDGRLGFNDVVAFFEHLDDPAVTDHVAAYDFNDNGRIDYDDLVALFREV